MDVNKWLEEIEKNQKEMRDRDQESKAKGILKGRYIREPYADNYAFYEIIRENKKTVRIRVITGIGDDWVLPMFGEEATVDKDYAINNIAYRDYLASFSRKK